MLKLRIVVLAALTTISISIQAAGGGGAPAPEAVDPTQHFHPKGKPPSKHTLEVFKKARETLPFDDTKDFEEAEKGFVAPLNSMVIKANAGNVAWDIERYQFFAEGREFDRSQGVTYHRLHPTHGHAEGPKSCFQEPVP